MLEDREIIDLYLSRDERAIGETAEKYGAYCYKIAYNLLLDDFDSEECVNDTYLRTWQSVPPTVPRVLQAFLAKIARNLALDRCRAKNAEKRSRYTESLDELAECVGTEDPSEQIELSELGAAISRFLLSEREIARRIFVRRYFFEDTISEIAKAHHIGEGYVKTLLHRVRKRLADFLREEGIYL